LVAWKDMREAWRAVADALPLLVRAEEVLVLEVVRDEAEKGEQARARADDAAAFLVRHGAPARGAAAGLRGRAVADEVLFAAERQGADLVVGGAYGHTRLREWAFGGVARDLLARCPICCLLSH
jgi:nucleotide-binding universal stress UspA family protein